jgi:hypothetical protein
MTMKQWPGKIARPSSRAAGQRRRISGTLMLEA